MFAECDLMKIISVTQAFRILSAVGNGADGPDRSGSQGAIATLLGRSLGVPEKDVFSRRSARQPQAHSLRTTSTMRFRSSSSNIKPDVHRMPTRVAR
jgi:hypothetical protein